jgi:predicted TIM-barrel fold metal-dependent hydrolase
MGASESVVVVSADCHAGPERISDFSPYTPDAFQEDLAYYTSCAEAYDSAANAGGRGGALTRDDRGLWDMTLRSQHLDADGVSAEVIFPQGSVPFARYPAIGSGRMDWTPTPEQRTVGPEIYNRWLADFCSVDAERHFGVSVLPITDVDASVREVARARAAGLRGGVSLPPIGNGQADYNDRAYDPLWAACQDLEMVLNLHGSAGIRYVGGPETVALTLTETDFFSHRTLWFLIFAGVFERFPRLRLAITEQRAHWVPPTIDDLDSIYRSPRSAAVRAVLPKPPSEYFATNCYVGASFMSRGECEMRDRIGTDRLMWGSDYPHTEGVWPWVPQALRWTFAGVDEPDLRLMLGGNAAACYGFDVGHLEHCAAEIGPTVDAIASDPLLAPPDDPGAELSWGFRVNGAWD